MSIHSWKCFSQWTRWKKHNFAWRIGGNFVTHMRQTWTKAAVDISPSYVRPYLRLMRADKPIGTWLVYIPSAWSISLATPTGCLPDVHLLALFGAGAFLMRGAGCVINDLWDKDFDKKVVRTKDRPLASGELSTLQALIFLSGLLSCSLVVVLQLNWYSVFLGATALVPVIVYPLCKRVTYVPQIVLGITLNWGILLGWAAVHGTSDWSIVLPLYLAGICWTVIYDTIYAHQDKLDDALIGVKSAALKFGDKTKRWLSVFGVTMVGSLTYCGYLCEQTWPFYVGTAVTASHLLWQIATVNVNDPADCWQKFTSNKYLGFIIFLSILLGTYVKE